MLKNGIKLRDVSIMLVLFVAALGTFSLNWRYSFTNGAYDTIGGESTIGALRVLRGEIPYRDFWTLYAPGHYYLLAAVFRIFGAQLMAEVVAASVFCALAIAATYALIRFLTENVVAGIAVASILFAALLNSEYYYLRLDTYPPTILSLVTSLILVVCYYQTAHHRYLLLAGLAAGLVVLFKHDVGAYTSAAICAGLLVHHLIGQAKPIKQWRSLASELVLFGAGLLIVVLPVALYFARVAGPDLWQDVVVFPLTDWRLSRPSSYPSLFDLGLHSARLGDVFDALSAYAKFAIPFVTNVLALGAMGLAITRRQALYSAMGTTFGVAFWFHFMGAHLQINTHIITMSMYAAAIGAVCCMVLIRDQRSTWKLAFQSAVTLLVVGWFAALAGRPAYNLVLKQRNPMVEINLPGVQGFRVTSAEAVIFNGLADFVDKHSTPDAYLYIGLNRHDTMVASELLGYLFLNRPIPVRYEELHPAVADRPKAQREMIADLETKRPPLIVLKTMFPDDVMDRVKADFQKTLPGVGATDLDDYIHTHYVPVAEFPPYQVLQRKGL